MVTIYFGDNFLGVIGFLRVKEDEKAKQTTIKLIEKGQYIS